MLATTMKGERRAPTKGRVAGLRTAAEAHQAEGRYQDAEPLLRQTLAIAEQVYGPEILEVAAILTNLAVVFKYLGRFAEAGPDAQTA